jgi:VWFA-related protein
VKRVFFILLLTTLLLPVARLAMQDSPPIKIELTGANTSEFPTVILTTNVYDRLGQPLLGLTQENFVVTGDLADRATIVSVENITDNDLAFSAVLAIDTSSSMAGAPFEKAIEAATSFVNLIGPNDPVAIVAFDSTERLVQDFTTDKDTLLNAINNLTYGGKTSLYDGSLLAVQKAADSGNTRRAVILLSDGAEFGGLSGSERNAALDEALKSGVPVYTIGLGYGFDRTYLQSLAGDTLAQYNESPTPDELLAIYNSLAATLRSQYVITLTVDIPADGTTYALEVQATTDAGSSIASADLRAPIPVPIVSLPDLPTSPISEPTEITAEVVTDDTIESAEFLLDESSAASLTEAPFAFTIDPAALSPGTHQFTFNVTDDGGDIGTASGNIEIAALPSLVTLAGLPEGEISETQTVVLDITGQTPAVSATYSIDGGESQAVDDAPYSYSIDPASLAPGDHSLNVDVLNEGGIVTSVSQPFTVAALPPVITITGIEDGQEIGETTVININTVGQTPVTSITVDLNDTEIANAATGEASFTLNPGEIQPGDAEFTITAVTESGASSSQTLSFSIAALPPQISISGITVGETVEDNRTVTVEVISQTPISGVTFAIDGNEADSQSEAPFMFDIDVLELDAGPHILSVTAANEAGESASADTAFVISDAPSQTATALAPTNTPEPTQTPTNTPNSTATAAESTQVAALVASSTADAQLGQAMTSQAVSASDAQSTLDAESTANAQATQNSEATSDARATANALATENAVATRDAQATSNAANTSATNDARATVNVESTGTAQSTQDALATTGAQTTLAAQSASDAQATLDAQAGPTAGSDSSDETPGTSATPTTLTTETQSAAAQNSNLLPILCVVAAIVLILVVLFLTVGRRRKTS